MVEIVALKIDNNGFHYFSVEFHSKNRNSQDLLQKIYNNNIEKQSRYRSRWLYLCVFFKIK